MSKIKEDLEKDLNKMIGKTEVVSVVFLKKTDKMIKCLYDYKKDGVIYTNNYKTIKRE